MEQNRTSDQDLKPWSPPAHAVTCLCWNVLFLPIYCRESCLSESGCGYIHWPIRISMQIEKGIRRVLQARICKVADSASTLSSLCFKVSMSMFCHPLLSHTLSHPNDLSPAMMLVDVPDSESRAPRRNFTDCKHTDLMSWVFVLQLNGSHPARVLEDEPVILFTNALLACKTGVFDHVPELVII